MLTQGDLQKIAQVVDGRLDSKFDEKLAPIKQEISSVKKDLFGVKKDLSGVKEDLSNIETRLSKKIDNLGVKIKKKINFAIGHFDRGDLSLEKRVKKIEDRFPFPTSM